MVLMRSQFSLWYNDSEFSTCMEQTNCGLQVFEGYLDLSQEEILNVPTEILVFANQFAYSILTMAKVKTTITWKPYKWSSCGDLLLFGKVVILLRTCSNCVCTSKPTQLYTSGRITFSLQQQRKPTRQDKRGNEPILSRTEITIDRT